MDRELFTTSPDDDADDLLVRRLSAPSFQGSLLDDVMVNGVKLGKCTRSMLQAEAARLRAKAAFRHQLADRCEQFLAQTSPSKPRPRLALCRGLWAKC